MKRELFTLLCLILSFAALSQSFCAFDLMFESGDDQWIDRGLVWQETESISAAPVVLPVVFHIIRNGGQGDVNNADVLASLAQLNDAFANRNFYNPATGVDTEISFCLAKQDESGLPTTGITRTESTLTTLTVETQDAQMKSLIHWDPDCYINIYIVFDIISQAVGGGVQGYANFPSAHGTPTDGLVVESRLMNGSPVNAAVLIHEMGHFLGLHHTFRGGCTNTDCLNQGDRICDTPPDNSTAPSDCADPDNSCNTDAQSGLPADVPDMVTNYMDYGYLDCRNDFTAGQADRMMMAINMERVSLLDCPSCDDPCSNPFMVDISNPTGTWDLDAPISLSATGVPGGSTSNWYSNGMLIGTGNPLNTSFSQEGTVKIVLEVIAADPTCVSYDTLCLDIICPTQITHDVRDTACLQPGSQLIFNANPVNASGPVEWYINGVLDQTGNAFTWIVPMVGVFELTIRVPGQTCDFESIIYYLYVNCRETCDNGIDDDGDGLIDGYDPDCCDTVNRFFFDPCYDNCPYEITDAFTTIGKKYESTGYRWSEANTCVLGDVDNDGRVEIVGFSAENLPTTGQIVSGNLMIVDAETGVLESQFDPGQWVAFSRNLSIADADGNGFAEIYFNSGSLRRVDVLPNGTMSPRWVAPGGGFSQPGITDFNEDGRPEILLDNGIVDAFTGQTLVTISTAINEGSITYIAGNAGSAAVDVLPSNFCPNCEGKELVVGNQVYSVDINGGSSRLNLEVEWVDGRDGYTSIVDFDLDGDLDAVVVYTVPLPNFVSERRVAVWDIQTPTALTSEYIWTNNLDRVAHPAVGDVTGDGKPEVVIADYSRLKCLSHNGVGWTELFDLVNDDRSGMSGPSLFDFDANGAMEVVHRDQSTVRIISGNGTVLFSDACISGTGYDIPTIADIDGDREAELVCSCSEKIVVYEPNPGTWALTRPVWNQLIYYAVNVNDDLTIPAQEQQHHLPGQFNELNFYIAQYGTKEYQAADLFPFDIQKYCDGDSVQFQVTICNAGPATFFDTLKITGYDADPVATSAQVQWQGEFTPPIIHVDSCTVIQFSIDRNITQLWMVINDDGSKGTPFDLNEDFPSTEIEECEYFNNIFTITGLPDLWPPDLGPDTVMCDFGIFTLDAGGAFDTYEWQDGNMDQIYTVFRPGKYWVTVMDSCGKEYSDTIVIRVDSSTVIDLGPDIFICDSDSVNLSIAPFTNGIKWTPSGLLNCDDCPNVQVLPDTTTVFTVRAETADGCIGFDSITIFVGEGYMEYDTLNVCENDSVMVRGVWLKGGDQLSDTIDAPGDCDSIFVTAVEETVLNLDLGPDFDACVGDTAFFDLSGFDSVSWSTVQGLPCPECPIQEVPLTGNVLISVIVFDEGGCSDNDEILIQVQDTIRLMDTLTLCRDDSIFVFGQWVSNPGRYEEVRQSTESCDTIQTIELIADNASWAPILDQVVCIGDTLTFDPNWLFADQVNWNADNGMTILCDTCPTLVVIPQSEGTIFWTMRSDAGCEYRDSFNISLENEVVLPDTAYICPQFDSVFFNGIWIRNEGQYQEDGADCDTVRSLEVIHYSVPSLILPDTIELEPDQRMNVVIQGDASGVNDYSWSSVLDLSCTNCPEPQIVGTSDGLITVRLITQDGCEITLQVYIKIIQESLRVFIPNSFTPNGDNLNDAIQIFTNDPNAQVDEVEIYDRWGELVYKESNFLAQSWQGWNGQLNGEPMAPAVFVIRIIGTASTGESFSVVQDITLVR